MSKLRKLFRSFGNGSPPSAAARSGGAFRTVYEIFPRIEEQRVRAQFPDIKDEFFWATFEKCKAYSLLGVETFYNLYRSIEYLAVNKIRGDFVECGVFLGGAILAMSDFAHHFGLRDRRFHLYDTFAGFPDNTSEVDLRGNTVEFRPHANFLETVRDVISRSLCAPEQFEIIQGRVEETLRRTKPQAICLLRLDTDYYESSRVELIELYPLLCSGGVLIVDDYGLFEGARRATDEVLRQHEQRPLLMRINFAVRAGIKP
jgi:O-methyltransferase